MRGPTPHRWITRVKESLVSLGPQVSASRMVRDYVTQIYEPLAAQANALSAADNARARALARWKEETSVSWPGVRINSVATDDSPADLGSTRRVTAEVSLDGLTAEDAEVQLLHGPVGLDGDLESPTVVAMRRPANDGVWAADLLCGAPGRYGYTVRVVPHHRDLASFTDLDCVTWYEPPTGPG